MSDVRDKASLCTISRLLNDSFSPVIPDMQRDYCWGLEKASSPIDMQKCSLFVEGLMRLFKASDSGGANVSIGLLYGYEAPPGSGSLNIIDGQQRLTTMYLLLGMIYRRIPDTEIGRQYRCFLVSETADGDAMPRLQYQSKSEAMYFLSDLVSKFFLSRSGRLSQIEQSKWYFKSYDADTNARSFLGAIRCIDRSLEMELASNPGFDFEGFARFLVTDVNFRYFDMGTREAAERAFITINTTGHPLTLGQNLRALALGLSGGADAYATALFWNEMEDWFWQHRPLSMDSFLHLAIDFSASDRGNDDAGRNFLLSSLPRIFKAYARCVEAGVDMCNGFAAQPMLYYTMRFGERAQDCDIDRLGHLLCNYTRYQKTGAADRQQAMDLVRRMPGPDLMSAMQMRHAPVKIINDEEKAKIQLLDQYGFDAALQGLLRRAEAHPMLSGRVAKVLAWCRERNPDLPGGFSVSKFRHYVECLYRIWGTDIDRRDDLDPVRRALLSLRHKAYPIVRRGEMVLSLCWKDYDWQRLMIDAPGLVRQLINHTQNVSLEEMAMKFADREYPYGFIIRDEKVLDGCRKRQLLRPCDPFVGIYYLQAEHTQWWVDQRRVHVGGSGWGHPKPYGQSALTIDHQEFNLTIGLVYERGERCRFRVELFRRPDSLKSKVNLNAVAESLRQAMRYDRMRHRYIMPCADASRALKCIREIMDVVSGGQLCVSPGG